MRELLDQHDHEVQFTLASSRGDFAATAPAYKELIMDFARAAGDVHTVDVNVTHGQGIGETIEKGWCIVGMDVDDCPVCRGLIINHNLHRKRMGRESLWRGAHSVDDLATQAGACLLHLPGT